MVLGMLYIISAPSGTGKSSLIKALLKTKLLCNARFSISYTTRTKRSDEKHAKDYYFISHDKFLQMIKKNAFIEYVKVFDNYYGTSREVVQDILVAGIDLFLDIDWQGAEQIRQQNLQVCSIFILPPSKNILDSRLRMRGQDSDDIIAKRMVKAVSEIKHYVKYDYLIVNDNFNIALLELKTIICAKRLRLDSQVIRHNALIKELLSS
ncbi:guanylate kinase [Candidatus Profftia sp. (ex Adelges kitamiensis)]|uniref:guanylate kinase n=1 Tax=Candidatus Profftia sp. (ex Adelges kitamiensis) TaxID=2864218 RepID=UPI001CE23EE1|nr:guanylate kinase [Candidatus Profftia sp. (ex Adelges kitamiensis)]